MGDSEEGLATRRGVHFLICVFACIVVICITIAYIETIKRPEEPEPLKIWEKKRGN